MGRASDALAPGPPSRPFPSEGRSDAAYFRLIVVFIAWCSSSSNQRSVTVLVWV
jgi:hypothetical protein